MTNETQIRASINQISERSHVSPRRVRRALKELESVGLVLPESPLAGVRSDEPLDFVLPLGLEGCRLCQESLAREAKR